MNDKTPNKKRVVEHSLTGCIDYDLYDDGSVEIVCPQCRKPRTLVGKAATDFMKWHKDNPAYKCMQCYVDGQNKDFSGKKKDNFDDRSDQIAYAQSFNLAVALLAPNVKDEAKEIGIKNDKLMKENILYWQKWFYEQLTNRDK